MKKLTEFDMAKYLDTDKLQKGYLDYNAEEGTPEDLLRAINTVARAKGMAKTAKAAGLSRDGLYSALSENGNPTFTTVCNILQAIGYKLIPTPIA